MTSSRDPGIDGLRGIAILGVLLVHATVFLDDDPVWRMCWLWGSQGVPLFFVVSGYLVALPWVRWGLDRGSSPRPSFADYWRRRVYRIEPPWLIAFVAIFFLDGWLTKPWASDHVLPTVTYTHDLLRGSASPITGHSWSLEREVRWYLVAPFVSLVALGPLVARRVLLIGCVLCLPCHAGEFAGGILAADVRASGHAWPERWPGWLALLSVPSATLVPSAGMAVVFTILVVTPPVMPRWIQGLGYRCYALYLFHPLAYQLPLPEGRWAGSAVRLAYELAIGLAAWRLIEVPCLAWAKARRSQAGMSDMRAIVPGEGVAHEQLRSPVSAGA